MSATAQPSFYFPTSAEVGQTSQHLELTILLYDFLCRQFSKVASVGSGQFVYWDPTDPSVFLAPDAIIKLGGDDEHFDCWKVWERGVPEVAVEIVSETDERDRDWAANLRLFQQLGVGELVRFDPEVPGGSLRIWDRVEATLVERPGIDGTKSRYMNGYWVVLQGPEKDGPTLRLSYDPHGEKLFPTKAEASRDKLGEIEQALLIARQEIRELEAELAARKP